MSYNTIKFEIDNQIARLTLNRPDKMNAFSVESIAETRAALKAVVANKAVRVLVLGGEGRGFCTGVDLTAPRPGLNPDDFDELLRDHFLPMIHLLRDLRIPTVAAVHGAAAGMGMALALSCDITVAAKSAYFLA